MNFDIMQFLDENRLISSVESFLGEYTAKLPSISGVSSFLQFTIIVSFGLLIIGTILRIFFGKQCRINQSISVSVGTLLIYGTTIFVYTLNPWQFSQYLSPLPFALFRKEILIIMPFAGAERSVLYAQILSLIILCFLVHISDFLLPTGHSIVSWLVFRLLTIVAVLFLNLAVNWALKVFLPEGLAVYAPMALLIVLALAIVIGLFNPLLCILFTVANPVVGLLYTFFFSNLIGKQITKAVISAGLLCALFYCLECLGYSVMDITQSAVIYYIPFILLLTGIWYLFDYKL